MRKCANINDFNRYTMPGGDIGGRENIAPIAVDMDMK